MSHPTPLQIDSAQDYLDRLIRELRVLGGEKRQALVMVLERLSPEGIAEARPEVRVSTTVCATPGKVSSRPSTAAAAAKDGTPGVTE